jgi:hypothetical protein
MSLNGKDQMSERQRSEEASRLYTINIKNAITPMLPASSSGVSYGQFHYTTSKSHSKVFHPNSQVRNATLDENTRNGSCAREMKTAA